MMWQDEWPQEAGLWWFYGRLYGNLYNEGPPELSVVKVCDAGCRFVLPPLENKRLIYIVNGGFLHKNDPHNKTNGKWQKVILPELPEEI